MLSEKSDPSVKYWNGDVVYAADLFYRISVQKIFAQDPQYKEESVRSIRYYEIRKDRMGMMSPTGMTDDASDCEFNRCSPFSSEINDFSLVETMWAAGTFTFADGTGLTFDME